MHSYGIAFESPVWLLLLLTIPLLWWWGRQGLTALSRPRRIFICLLRSAVVALFVLAAAELQLLRRTDRVAVLYLLDQSASIPAVAREGMITYANAAVARHRQPQDMAGAIVFGREAAIEVPPYDERVHIPQRIESTFDPSYTNVAVALRLAQAAFPHDAAKRIVLVSDGNQNLGDALDEARRATDAGIGIDVVPVRYRTRSEVLVEKLTMPPDVRKGQPFDLRVVINNLNDVDHVTGRLSILQTAGDQPQVLSNQPVDLPPGKSVFAVRQQIDRPNFYTYEAQFVPDDPAADAVSHNNKATTFTHVRGKGQVLLIENHENRGEHEQLVDRLRANNIEVTVQPSNQLFTSLTDLQPYDSVILANVPRSAGEDPEQGGNFTDEQIRILVRNTEYMGAGLVMLGGPNSFGAGGWTNTELEKAMPVEFQIKNAKVIPSGALMLVLDHSGSMSGDKLEMSKAAAIAAIRVLGERDMVGVVEFDSAANWVVPMSRLNSGQRAIQRVAQIGAGGGTNMMPGMSEGARALARAEAAVKHMIVLTDGHTEGTGYAELAAQMRRQGMTTTAIAVGRDADFPLMERIAQAGGGKFYRVEDPRAIPRIFMKEALRVAKSVIYEDTKGFQPLLRYPHEITSGLKGPLPPLTGFMRTTLKQNPLVELPISSPVPADESDPAILATWTYGSGRAVAFTTDDAARWAKQWAAWPEYDKFFSQLVRWSMRPVDDTGKFTVATEVEANKVKVFVTALDKDDEFMNFLDLGGTVIGPGAEPRDVRLTQTAPGRYIGEFDVDTAGSYFMVLNAGAGMTPLRTGINVPYSAEYADREPNVLWLESLAHLTPAAGGPGVVLAGLTGDSSSLESLLTVDSFRRDLQPAASRQGIWPPLVLAAACLFFCDVFFRRVTIELAPLVALAVRYRDKLFRKQALAPATEYMDRLRSRKAEVAEHFEQQRATARFEAAPEATVDTAVLEAAPLRPAVSAAPAAPKAADRSPPPEQESYTSRLLKAKQKVWEERDKGSS